MKTIKLLFATTLLFALTSNAQITKGNWMVGGSASFSSSNTKADVNTSSTKSYDVNLNPEIGYFIINKLSGGLRLSLINSSFKSDQGNSKYSNTEIGPFVRYYFLNAERNTNVFLEPSYNFTTSKNNNKESTIATKGGFVVFLNSSVGFEVSLEYLIEKFNNVSDTNTIKFGIGVQVHLEKQK